MKRIEYIQCDFSSAPYSLLSLTRYHSQIDGKLLNIFLSRFMGFVLLCAYFDWSFALFLVTRFNNTKGGIAQYNSGNSVQELTASDFSD